MTTKPQSLTSLTPGMLVLINGDQYVAVSEELAAAFAPGDALVTTEDGELIHLTSQDRQAADTAVTLAHQAFEALGQCSQDAVTTFFETFAQILCDDEAFGPIQAANDQDVAKAKAAGKSTTRLVLSPRMRTDMAAGLREWAALPGGVGEVLSTVAHEDWRVDLIKDRLGVIGFVFEGRPNVFADACGVLRSGNTVVFRIGSDALGTALAMMTHAIEPALERSGLPNGVVSLVNASSRESGFALVGDPRLALAVVRGSGRAVHRLGSVAARAGNNISLHGRGGAWLLSGYDVDTTWYAQAIEASLDRKVCNTLNTIVIPQADVDTLLPIALDAVIRAGERAGFASVIHVTPDLLAHLSAAQREERIQVGRAGGLVEEARFQSIAPELVGQEWEWEDSPEVTITVARDVPEAMALYNRYSPHFVVSYIDNDEAGRATFEQTINAPFISNAFTRWVDGQYALNQPELGLGNWERGRLLARGGLLTGNTVYAVRTRATSTRGDQRR